jgi:methyl-accepting chemotaxis protein
VKLLTKLLIIVILTTLATAGIAGVLISRRISRNVINRARDITADYIATKATDYLERADFVMPPSEANITHFEEFLSLIRTSEIIKIKVFNSSATIIYSTDTASIGDTTGSENYKSALVGTVAVMIKDPLTEGSNIDLAGYQQVMEIYVPIDFDGRIVGVIETYYKMDFINDYIRGTVWAVIALLSGFVVVIMAAVTILLTVVVTGPMSRMTVLMRRISEGTGDLTIKMLAVSKDEIGVFGKHFNTFIDTLRDLIGGIRSTASSAGSVRENLDDSSRAALASLRDIVTRISAIMAKIETCDGHVSSSAGAIRKIVDSVSQLNTSVQKQTGIVEESTSAVTQMNAAMESVAGISGAKKAAVQRLQDTSKVGRDKLNSMNETVGGIADQITGIQSMLTIIDQISAQTNLLSINAAIEAAHAREAGTGFAVVAGEIRQLAVGSAEQAKGIETALRGIIERIETADTSSGATITAFADIEKGIDEVTGAFDEILVSNAELSAGSGHIQSTMIELSDVSKNVHRESSDIADSLADISSAVTELGSISSDLVANIKVIRVSTEEVTAEMTQVNDFIDNLNKNVQELNSDVNRFHLE